MIIMHKTHDNFRRPQGFGVWFDRRAKIMQENKIRNCVNQLEGGNTKEKLDATEKLEKMANEGTDINCAIEGLAKALGNEDYDIMNNATKALENAVVNKKTRKKVLKVSINALENANPNIKMNAARILRIAVENNLDISCTIGKLVELLWARESKVRNAASGTLMVAARMGVDITCAIEALINNFGDEDANLKFSSTRAISYVAEKATFKTKQKITETINIHASSKRFILEMEKNTRWYIIFSNTASIILEILQKNDIREAA